LILVRHGQTPSNVAGAMDTARPGALLTDVGRRQADALVTRLAGVRIAGVYASVLSRAQLSARPLARHHGLPVSVCEGLEEIRAGDELEMRTDGPAATAYATCLARWLDDDLAHTLPGVSDGNAFLARYDAAVSGIAAQHRPDACVVAFSHGAAIRVWTTLRARGLTAAHRTEGRLMNTGAVTLDGSPETGWRLASWTSEPLGGRLPGDRTAHDVTGEPPQHTGDFAVPA
jgi:broad specificity phosphatase PhoE